MKLALTKTAFGFIPATQQDTDLAARYKIGANIVGEWTEKRNYEFHKKFFALLNIGFDAWEPGEINSKYGIPEKNFDKFRNDVIVMAGYFDPVIDLNGKVKVVAKSIKFGKMEQEDFEKLYSAIINVLLKDILTNYTKNDIDNQVQRILNFT